MFLGVQIVRHCNYDISASYDNGTCISLESLPYNNLGVYYDCDGVCFNDDDGDGVVVVHELEICRMFRCRSM